MEILQIKNLSFRYQNSEKLALNNIDLSVNEGEFIVVCGESGCGKSTLVRMLKRELSPYGERTGEVFYQGVPRDEIDKRKAASEIGFVLQNPESQIVTDFVWHELAFGLENLGCDSQYIRRRTAEMASYFGIQDWYRQKTHQLSGGQKQLLNLAAIMAMQPKILLLDEPTAQLDPIAASNFIATLQKLNRELGLTIILVEHRLEEVFPIADRVVIMDNGGLVYDDKPEKISSFFKHNPSHPMISGAPAAMRIFSLLGGSGDAPLTVREGREYIISNYDNRIDSVSEFNKEQNNHAVVKLQNVFFRYEREMSDTVNGLNLSIHKGEHFCILGGNGTGKTTTLNIIGGLLTPYRGKVFINGKRIREYKGNSLYINNIALLPQNPQTVFIAMTLREDLLEICKALNYTQDEYDRKIAEICEKFSISHLLGMHPYDLSGGEQQKAALAKVMLADPQILLLDEPTKGIDAYAKTTLSDIITALKNEGITVVTVTHDVEFAAASADRCGLFFDGEMVSVDTPNRFFSQNNFYTTGANRITRGYFKNAILCEQVAELCRINGRKRARDE